MPRQLSKLHGEPGDKAKYGGWRPNSGRPPGTGHHQALREKLIKKYGITPLEYMMRTLADDRKRPSKKAQDAWDEKRMWAAEKAAPYMHPKLNAVTLDTEDNDDDGEGLKIVFVKAKRSGKK